MSDFQKAALNHMLREQLGESALFFAYDPPKEVPMRYVLDAVKSIGRLPIEIWWVQGGHPEVFCLEQFQPVPIVFSTRHVSFSTMMRGLFVDHYDGPVLFDNSFRLFLKLIAELALRKGNTQLASIAFMKSMVGKGITFGFGQDEDIDIFSMEIDTKESSFMTTWFYGIAHEAGHLPHHDFPGADFLNSEWFDERIASGCEHLGIAMPTKERLEHIHEEAVADVFAVTTVFLATIQMMKEYAEKEFEVDAYCYHAMVAQKIIQYIATAHKIVEEALDDKPVTAEEWRLLELQFNIRELAQRYSLVMLIAGEFKSDADDYDHVIRIRQRYDQIYEQIDRKMAIIEQGLKEAWLYIYDYSLHEPEIWQLDNFARHFKASRGIATIESKRFCRTAEEWKATGGLMEGIFRITYFDQSPVIPEDVPLVYYYVCKESPEWFRTPMFINMIEDENVLFIFKSADQSAQRFMSYYAPYVPSGYRLRAIPLATTPEIIAEEALALLKDPSRGKILFEGTPEFDQHFARISS